LRNDDNDNDTFVKSYRI